MTLRTTIRLDEAAAARLERLLPGYDSDSAVIRAGLEALELQQSAFREHIRRLILDLLAAIEEGDDFDALLRALGALLGSSPAAEGINEALRIVVARREAPEPAGLVLDEVSLAWLDELVQRSERAHTRESMVEALISAARRRREGDDGR